MHKCKVCNTDLTEHSLDDLKMCYYKGILGGD